MARLPKINLVSLGLKFAAWFAKKSISKLITKKSLKTKNKLYMAETRVINFQADEVDVIVTAEQIDGGDIQVTVTLTNSDLVTFTYGTNQDIQFFVGSRPKKRKK